MNSPVPDPLISEEAEVKATAQRLTDSIDVLARQVDDLNRRTFWMIIAGALVLFLAIAVGILSWRTYAISMCQEHIIQANRIQLEAQDRLFTAVRSTTLTPEEHAKSLADYQDLIRAVNADRAAAKDRC
jgi:hypothetical protein